MADYAKTAESALKAISKAGNVLPIVRSSPVFDDLTGIPEADPPETSGEIRAIRLPKYKGSITSEMDLNIKQAIVSGRATSFLAAAKGVTFEPAPLDVITCDGSQWQIFGVNVLSPAGIPLVYTIGAIQQ